MKIIRTVVGLTAAGVLLSAAVFAAPEGNRGGQGRGQQAAPETAASTAHGQAPARTDTTASAHGKNRSDAAAGHGKNRADTAAGRGKNRADTAAGRGKNRADTAAGRDRDRGDSAAAGPQKGRGRSEDPAVARDRIAKARQRVEEHYQKRVAHIDEIRGAALADGNTKAVQRCDRLLEQAAQVRERHLRQIEQMESRLGERAADAPGARRGGDAE